MPEVPPNGAARGLVVAGTASGVGKTTVSVALALLLKARGYRVQPYKCGPDYIDPGYLSAAAGRTCRNLDSYLVPPDVMRELFAHAAADADVALIEGVMGLYDGRRGPAAEGSTAEVAKLLRAPVILVIDAAKMSASAAAIVIGFQVFDPEVKIVGVIANNIGSVNHLRGVREAIESRTGLPLLGHLPREAVLNLPERHLGLTPSAERPDLETYLSRFGEQALATFNIEALLGIIEGAALRPPEGPHRIFPPEPVPARVNIAVARDQAFSFYYQDNVDLLAAWGARPVMVSPLEDAALPQDIGGLYLGGGFPEVFAARLSANTTLLRDLRERVAAGMPVYAECGGLIYLCRSITDFAGASHPMTGLIPADAVMQGKRRRLSYATARAARDSVLLAHGETVRGHLFHWSDVALPAGRAAYQVTAPEAGPEGRPGLIAQIDSRGQTAP